MRKALLVGINKYRLGCHLRGCLNDVKEVLEVLKLLGWSAREVRVLTDERATAKGIREGLLWLVDKAKPGDTLFFYFSGHGSQVRDVDGDELADQMDEVLCPHDFSWDGVWLSDDLLRAIFAGVDRGVLVEQVFDCCHSGTLHREFHLRPGKARFIPPPLDFLARQEPLPVSRFRDVAERGSFWAACREDQVAREALVGLQFRGLFTATLFGILKRNPRLPRSELFAQVAARLSRSGQSPVHLASQELGGRPFLA